MSLTARATGIVATILTAGVVNIALFDTAHAYIDPGTGTMLLQVAGAMIAAGLFYLRTARLWIARQLGLGKSNPEQTRTGADNDSNPQ